jgi:acyl phosphate:glycerol-3-phosphate acyltransferase
VVYVLTVLIGYVLGSIPVALMIGRAHGVDLRHTGDRNPGAWNALEQLGGRKAFPVFIGDGAKGLIAGLVGLVLAGIPGAYAGVAAAMIGHAFPVFAGFRGGKSVMTFAGGAFAITPIAAAISLALCGLIAAVGSFAWGARVGVFAFPVVQLLFVPVEQVAATGGLMCLIGVRFLMDRYGPARTVTDAGTRA